MSTLNLPNALAFAQHLAKQAAQVTQSLSAPPSFTRKSDNSPVTEADRRIQDIIAHAIAERYPNHAFLGEEEPDQSAQERNQPTPNDSEYCWIVDPLDGTRNFTHGFPIICTSIALLQGDQPILGVVHEHSSGWRCSAIKDQGTTCNGRRVRIDRATSRGDLTNQAQRDIIIAVPSARNHPMPPVVASWLTKYVLRNVGCTALHMAYVAAGAVDACICHECKIWDIAAGYLLIQESGGHTTDLDGQPLLPQDPTKTPNRNYNFLTAAPKTLTQLFKELTTQ